MEEWLIERLIVLSRKERDDVEGVVPYLLGIQDEKDRREFIEVRSLFGCFGFLLLLH